MATTGLSDLGEEWVWKTTFRQDRINSREDTIEILLYNDNTDSLDDTSDLSDIGTEPTDGEYSRETLSLDSTDLSLQIADGDMRLVGSVTFNTTNTTGSINAWAAVVNFESDIVNSETSKNPHLLSTGASDSRDLSTYSDFDVNVVINLD